LQKSTSEWKFLEFATPDQIRHNSPFPIAKTLLELEEILVSLRISFAQIRQWG
jgi:hypothetical protein